MKKISILLLSIILTVSFYGCGESSSSATVSTSKKPDDISLMCYAQTVLRDFYPDCEYSHNKEDYIFTETALRYKIKGDVTVTNNSITDQFSMIIQFTDEQYDTYDLISLQVGDEKIYENNKMPEPSSNSKYRDNEILTEKNHKIYNDVMDILYDNYDRSEDELLKEIAPQYGMTAVELKEFLYDYMDAYYDYMGDIINE